ncbi:hypothetical protein NP233_g4819 [Leucocoprinus birnbaumii]|uniref:Uncharacterized protein n=1 Tax=Leucocoprinus birnbaumii TaxID=56174 RepID=A0AAD5VXN6_9AGAR|nr:hypothetical protein NP233_g4819 [Leucocoprinus birnbaumii]
MPWEWEISIDSQRVVQNMEKDGVVVFLWSNYHFFCENVFRDTCPPTDWMFHAHRFNDSRTGRPICLICIPEPTRLESLTDISYILERCPAVHIWLEDIKYYANRYSVEWLSSRLSKRLSPAPTETNDPDVVLSTFLSRSSITFLTVSWEQMDLEEGEKREMMIKESLRVIEWYDFERLATTSGAEFQQVMERVIAGNAIAGGCQSGRTYSVENAKQEAEDWRVSWLQREIDTLYVALDRTTDGRRMRRRLTRAFEDQRKYIEPLLARVDDESLKDEERDRLEEEIEEEYTLSRREFLRHFMNVQEMGITIGPRLKEFYGVPERVRLFFVSSSSALNG